MSAIAFYDSSAWRMRRAKVLSDAHNECQLCKRDRHKHVRAEIVHHIYHLDEYPQYGLAEYVTDPETGEQKQNLIAVCRNCHETVCHPERLKKTERAEPLTEEKW